MTSRIRASLFQLGMVTAAGLFFASCKGDLYRDDPEPYVACNEFEEERPEEFSDGQDDIWRVAFPSSAPRILNVAYRKDASPDTITSEPKNDAVYFVFLNIDPGQAEEFLDKLAGTQFLIPGPDVSFSEVLDLRSERRFVVLGKTIKVGNKKVMLRGGLPVGQNKNKESCAYQKPPPLPKGHTLIGFERDDSVKSSYFAWPVPNQDSPFFVPPRVVGVTLSDGMIASGERTLAMP